MYKDSMLSVLYNLQSPRKRPTPQSINDLELDSFSDYLLGTDISPTNRKHIISVQTRAK